MYSSNDHDETLMKEIIMDHYQNPRNHQLVNTEDYLTVKMKNPSCGDDLTIQVKLNKDQNYIEDIRQLGTGCSICCASASMMSELLSQKEIQEAKKNIKDFKAMVSAEPFDEDELEDAIALQGVSKVPPRIKCATLAWLATEKALEGSTGLYEVDSDDIKEKTKSFSDQK